MDQHLLSIRENTYHVHYAIDGRTQFTRASIGMVSWDNDLAQAQIADRLGVRKEQVTVLEHKQVGSA
jgi:hypothetical protein